MINITNIITILSLPSLQWAVVILAFLGLLAWVEIKILRIFFISRNIVSQVIHIGSTHKNPIPCGGGIAIIDMFLIALVLWIVTFAQDIEILTLLGWRFFCAILIVCVISLIDDFKPLHPLPRLLVQMMMVAIMMPLLPGPVLLGYVPLWLDGLFVFLFWTAFTNFFNFMDGIDGMSGVEMGSIGAGLIVVGLLIGSQELFFINGLAGLALLIGAIVFLMWNWHPAKIFLGDSGSVPIGFIIAGLMLQLSSYGYWEAAVILPLYYYMDAGITTLKRIARGEKVWLPHVSNYFHKARIAGYSHNFISRMVLGNNILLILFAGLSLKYEMMALVGAFLTTSLLLIWMRLSKPKK